MKARILSSKNEPAKPERHCGSATYAFWRPRTIPKTWQSGIFHYGGTEPQRGLLPATKSRLLASLGVTCHPGRSEGSVFLCAPRRSSRRVGQSRIYARGRLVDLQESARRDRMGAKEQKGTVPPSPHPRLHVRMLLIIKTRRKNRAPNPQCLR